MHALRHTFATRCIVKEAIHRTARKRGSEEELKDWKEICEDMRGDETLRALWLNYQNSNKMEQKRYAGTCALSEDSNA
ncbi:hypothetical protein SAMN04487928_16010 [Butyrivibrio proteoclasticus]|uniref:Uncharacterized protein n=1 Tax=Butyrivibrio proteoclasticus TaxID=43305 RepID=A0A1I5YWJ9_9FIRM|nr:hypothetical protein [Butyrivibrio proteoclasticus]SFQ48582.1 hypothetical protein SAMN04487928_16010 [Butyrivibrio proteoclasticus]